MQQQVYDAAYEQALRKYFDSSLPDKIYDAHFHISRAYTKSTGYAGEPFSQYSEFMERYLGRPIQGGMVMAQPSAKHTPETMADENAYNLELAQKHHLAAGLLIMPSCGRDKTERYLAQYPQIKVLKPYLTYAAAQDKYEADVLDFAPEWMWSLAHDREMPILIHLSHYQNMLSDKKNIEQLRYVCKKYPRAKVILAHCAMGHHVFKLKQGLEQIRDLDNIWFDCSGNSEALSVYYCLKDFGIERMMYGGDYDYGAFVGRICSYGSNFLALHSGYIDEEVLLPNYRYQPLNNVQECALALLQAAELLNLKATDLEKICFHNAAALFA